MGNEWRKNYPSNWEQIRRRRLKLAKGRCECRGRCGTDNHGQKRCPNVFKLNAAHLCRPGWPRPRVGPCWPPCGKISHIRMMCPRCHAGYDGRILLTRDEREIAELQAEPPSHVLEDLTLLDAWIFRHDYDVFSGVKFPYPMAGSHERLIELLFPF